MTEKKRIPIHKVVYRGKGISLNQMYSSHWRTKQGLVNGLAAIFEEQIEWQLGENPEKLQELDLVVRYNSTFDIDNASATAKVFVDVLRRQGIIENDTPKFYKSYSIQVDEDLPRLTYIFELYEPNYESN